MVRNIVLIFALIATASGGVAARDREPEQLDRSGKWLVNYDRDACHLIAQFGTGDDMVIARFTRYEPGYRFDLALYGRRFRSALPRQDAKLDFGLKGTPVTKEGMMGNADKLPAMFFSSVRVDGWAHTAREDEPPTITPEQERAVAGLTVSIGGKRPFRLTFGSLGKPLAEVRTCSVNLLKSWGYDPAEQAALQHPVTPINAPGRWLVSADYPSTSLSLGHNGTVQFRLDVDAEGKVAGCYVLARTSPDDFADLTCRAVSRRAKLKPALDGQGKPIRSYFVQSVHWITGS